MDDTHFDAYRYSYLAVIVFGILGNLLVIISLLRQKNMLKSNYYFLVLHLAICDFGALILYLLEHIKIFSYKEARFYSSKFYCLASLLPYFIQTACTGTMLTISVLRYRATVHPMKPAISRRKLKLVCGLVYVVALIAGYGPSLPICFLPRNELEIVYEKSFFAHIMICFIFIPTIFMIVVYIKIGRTLSEHKEYIKQVCSNPDVTRTPPYSSFDIVTYLRNRKTFFVCILTAFCYVFANIFLTVHFILVIAEKFILLSKHPWISYCSKSVRMAGWHSANPLIYGIFDKKALKFWKRRRTTRRRPPQH
jgi:hypothetical protein